MANLPQLNSGYILPFDVIRSRGAVLSTGQQVKIALRMRASSTEAFEAAQEILRSFTALANTGGLAGETIAPHRSRAMLQVSVSPGTNEVVAQGVCELDERAALVLVHMLLARQERLGLQSVYLLLLEGDANTERLAQDTGEDTTYPTLPAKLPFAFSDADPGGGGVTFQAEFVDDVRPETEAAFQAAARAWTEVVLAGGYALAPVPAVDGYVEPDEVVAFDNVIEWPVFKLRAADEAVYAMVAVLHALHERVQALRGVSIE